MYFSKFYRF